MIIQTEGWGGNWRRDEKLIGSSHKVNCWRDGGLDWGQNKRWERRSSQDFSTLKEDAHLGWSLGPYHFGDGCEIFTIATDSWRGDGRKTSGSFWVYASLTANSLPSKRRQTACFLSLCQRNVAVCERERGGDRKSECSVSSLLMRAFSVNLHLRSAGWVHLLFSGPVLLRAHYHTHPYLSASVCTTQLQLMGGSCLSNFSCSSWLYSTM